MDRFAEKFPWQSPYVHAGNNPVNYVDVNGDSIWFSYEMDSNGELTAVTMHVAAKVVNISGKKVNMGAAAKSIANQIESSFSGEFDGVSFTTEANITAADSMDDVADSDHVFALAEIEKVGGNTVFGGASSIFGKVAFVDADYFRGPWDTTIGNTGPGNAAHEFGHLTGLRHPNKGGGLMQERNGNRFFMYSTSLKSRDLRYITNEAHRMNQGPNREYLPIYSPTAGKTINKPMPYRGLVKPIIKYR